MPSASSDCPTPLAWQEVVRAVVAESTEASVEVDGATFRWLEFGSGRRLLVLPGVTGTPRLFALTAWLLKDEYRCVMLAHPEWREQPPVGELIPRTAGAIAKLLPSFASSGLELYGYGYGGQVALGLLAQAPGFVEGAMIQGGWASRRFNWTERCVLKSGTILGGRLRRVPLWLSVQIQNHRPWFPPFDETRFGFLLQETSATRTCEAARRQLAAGSTDLTSLLPQIDTPVLLIRGEGEGRMIGAAEENMKQLLAHATEECMHTTGQFPFLTHPHRLVKVIRAWRDGRKGR